MINSNKYHTVLLFSLLTIFLFWSLGSNEIQFEILHYSGFEDSIIPELNTKTISVNLLLLAALLITATILSLIFVVNLKIAIYVLIFAAPLVRQVDYINVYFGKILPLLIIVGYLIHAKFRVKSLKFPNEIRLYIAMLIIGLTLSVIYNQVSPIPIVRQVLFFVLVYIIYEY
jgi:hypothetical protein